MILHHSMCQDHDCKICLDDHIALEQELKKRCGGANLDWLSKYHKFITLNFGEAETEFGWATPKSFDESNIDAFVNDWKRTEEN